MLREIEWADLWSNGEFQVAQLAGATEIVAWNVESPRTTAQTMRSGGPERWPQQVKSETADALELEGLPDSVERITLHLVGDTALKTHIDAEVVLLAEQAACFGAEGLVTHLTVGANVVFGAIRHTHDRGQSIYGAHRFVVERLELAEPMGRCLGGFLANALSVPDGSTHLDLRRPELEEAEWMFTETIELGDVDVPMGNLTVLSDRDFGLSKWSCDLVVQAAGATVRIHDSDSSNGPLDIEASKIVVSSGQLTDVVLTRPLDELTLGTPVRAEEETSRVALQNALIRSGPAASVLNIRGAVRQLVAYERATLVASDTQGLQVETIEADESSELFNLSARELSTSSVVSLLRHEGMLSLWVPASARTAAQQFEADFHVATSLDRERIAMRRGLLLRLAERSGSDGHVLAVLREAERDARRQISPVASRERVLLGIQRMGFRYGERIMWPLVVGATLVAVLAAVEVGASDLNSRSWWLDLDEERIMRAFEFALPGLSILGLEAFGGMWAVLAKVVSTVCVASALGAGRKITRARH